ncbi:MAG: Crp/Fnr family transcriptional regulator [Saprospiraceae bacterium]
MKNIIIENQSVKIAFLKTVPLLKSLDEENLEYLSENIEEVKLRKYSFLYKMYEVADQLFILKEGIVKISTFTSDSREVIKGVIHSTMTFNGHAITSQNNVLREDAQSMDRACVLYAVDSAVIRELLHRNFQFTMDVMTMMSHKIKKTEARLESLILEDARTRVINFLKDNANKFGKKVGIDEMLIRHSFTQQDIANFTGTSRQTVTTILNDLKKKNQIILSRKRILIRDIGIFSS